ncbi:protocadherin Fat 3 isoform X6 [Caretta caretta]|uniref:protocadherin Fat 3 isoform X6 n=1 Tax=Caretta caretta TaxID=8467 RepID=UPI003F4B70B2
MEVTMGCWSGTRPPLSCLTLLLVKLLACVCEGLHGTIPLDFHFTHSIYNATVYENSAARTYVNSPSRMGITLVDLSWDIKYRIVSGDEEGFFKAEEVIIADFCFLRIRTKGGNSAILNREIQDNYLLIVKGSVRGEDLEAWTKVNIQVLDMNDLRPLFSPTTYSVTIAESTPLRTSIAQVTATDADIGSNGEFYYYFKNKVDLFSVHPTSGVVSLSGRLNYDEKNRYDLEVLAVDRGMKLYGNNGVSSTAKLYVHIERINEHAPAISVVTHVPFPLDKEPTYAVINIDDLDEGANGEIESVSIVAGDPLEQFFLAKEGKWINEYKIKERKPIDWDNFPYGYNLTLQAKDKGSPQKFSAVKLVHIASPKRESISLKFEKEVYDVSISEFSPPGVAVVIVKLMPEPQGVEYTISPNQDAEYFKINPRTGLIITARPLKIIEKELYELEVVNKGGDLKAQVIVRLEDANDHTPEFTQPSYSSFVNESVPVGTSVLSVSAFDKDRGENGYITYSIASLNSLPFTINQFTGVISTSEELDFESSPESYRFIVRASDWGSPYRHESEVNVTVYIGNVNDNKPLFEKVACQGVISSDFPIGGHITAVSAIDIDELELVKYKIISGNDLGIFYLNPDSGVLQLKKSLVNSGIKNSNFGLRITATDGENFADAMFINISVVHGKVSSKTFSCRETRVAQKLAEKLLKKAKANVKLNLEDGFLDFYSINRQAPHFDKSFPSDVAVREDFPVGASILKIKAYDADSGFNGKVVYTISDGNTDSCFNIDMETGLLKVLMPMDREKTDLYLLNITIYDLGDPQKSTWRLLTVTVEDANDNRPVFLQDSYSVNILESMSIGTEMIQVEARDKDLGSSGEVTYSILTDTQQFAINISTGVVYVADQLDRELKANYTLKIEARDKAEIGHQQFSVVPLKVFLDDVNDCSPAFIPSSYSVKVLEDLPVGTVIAWLETHDPDLGLGGQVRYSLVNDYNGRFEIDKTSGTIRLNKELDYEKQQFYNLTVRAKDKGRPVSLSSVSFVEVEVVDVNENLYAPYFPDFAVIGTVKENSRTGTSVLQVIAQDEDSGRDGEIQYSIRDGSGLGRFSIDEETGVIYTADVLDRETTKSYWLTVYATDRGVVPLYATIEVYVEVEDVNDNAPLTSQPIYYPAVMENSPKDVSVIQIQAQDPDSSSSEKLTYRITSGNPQNFFAINPKTGLIMTTSRKLDREQQAEHFLEVTVTDGGVSPKQSTVWVVVQVLDENDNKPQFPEKVYQIKLPERDRKKRGEPIYRAFAFDKDEGPNAEISYSIVDGNDDGKFFIDPKTGMVSSRKQFTAGNYDILTIKAVDNGRPQKSSTARLHIEWIKKPVPSPVSLTFDEPFYNFTVMESDKVTEIVGVVSVQPANIPLWFDVVGGKHAREMFYILQTACGQNCSTEGGNFDSSFDAEKGVGTIVIAKPLDAEQRSIYNMTVEVTDGTNVATTQVLIKVLDNNDNGPEFSHPSYDVTISEDILPDTEILQVEAIDRDEKHKLSYTVHSSIDSVSMRKFRIDPSTGVLYTAERLDHEAQDKHILNVMVRDQEFPYRRNLARVIINVEDSNDHSPYFTSPLYEASVYESAAIGSAVLQVTALDKDKGENAELIYTMEAGNTGNTFKIEPVLGIITVLKEPDLTTMGQFVLSVKVTDQGSPPLSATAIVRISVTMSDNSHPKFTHKEYQAEVNENVDIGTSVILISAISQSTLVYEVKDGNVDGAFAINPYSGVITSQKPLDYERTSSYQLIVQATNMAGMASNATANIQILDENDNLPVFILSQYLGSISEAAPVNSIVRSSANNPLVIRATDADSNQNALLVYQIVESTAKKYFTVDSSTGAIRTIANLDHETIAHFHFHVHVRDSGNPQLTAESPVEVTIEVTDINDNPPVFSQAVFETVLLLPTYIGVEVLKVKATDPDSEVPPELTYSLIEGNMDHFLIDSGTGVLTIKNNTLSKDHYMLVVRVSDGKFYSTAMVTIMVKEAMDSGLHFTQSFYSTSISENSTNITKIAVVNAVGNRLNEPLKYGILNPGNKFKIKSTSGVIETTGIPFDREKQELYELVVEASRELDHLRVARVVVRVNIEDINDNAPVFVGLPYYAAVQVDAEPGTLIYRVTAIDKDKGANGEVSYLLKEDYGHFEIDRQTGSVTLREAFNSDLSNIEYLVIILAKDGGNPSLSASVELPITIVNKAMPVFDKPFYTASVNEDIEMHTPILSINATSPEGQGIIYIIVDGDPYNQFNIDFDTGILSVISPLDYEVNSVFKMTVRASDALTGARAEVTVDLIINDVNDNPPVFDHSAYNATLSEASLIGTPVLQVVATDADSENNKNIQYQIVQDSFNSTDYFHIDSTSGLILTARMLDHELLQQCSLKVRAADNGFPPLSSEVLVSIYVTDMNDNPPVFNQLIYESYVSELAPRGHFVTCVQASDADSSDFDRLEYSILSGNDRTSFLMDSKSGIITLSNHRKQRMEPMYSLNVSVSDGLFTSTAQVHIHILGANLYSPVFSQSIYVAEVRENAAPGTKVIHVKATDGDSGIYGQINYSIINDFAKDRFLIDNNGQILTTEKLDRENPLEGDINIFLRALDGGGRMTFCTVRVIVVDENDNTPQFLTIEYRASVKADVGKGHLVTQVQALDPDDGTNSRITYSLYSEASVSVADLLEIDPDNGWMVTKVVASDLGEAFSFSSTTLVSVTVTDINDNTPVFEHEVYKGSVKESDPPGEVVAVLSTWDEDTSEVNRQVSYHITGGNPKGKFALGLVQNEWKVYVKRPLDREEQDIYFLNITATDGLFVTQAAVEVTVMDVNDNSPVCDQFAYTALFPEDIPSNKVILKISAKDADIGSNGEIRYSLFGPGNNKFFLDPESGELKTLALLDREKIPVYNLIARATDGGGRFCQSEIHLFLEDVNDNPPMFSTDHYTACVYENTATKALLTRVQATDPDVGVNRKVVYSLADSADGYFSVDRSSGIIILEHPLDRELQPSYNISVKASDQSIVLSQSSFATVTITVLDVNDNPPVFERRDYLVTVPEDTSPGTKVLAVFATSKDIGTNAEITYLIRSGNEKGKFRINSKTGSISVIETLDYEMCKDFYLRVEAKDGGTPALSAVTTVNINVTDVNDNAPKFNQEAYSAVISEDASVGDSVIMLIAEDQDSPTNGQIHFSIVNGDRDNEFSVDPVLGLIKVKKKLDRERVSGYSLVIQARDSGIPPMSSSVTVNIDISDVNDNSPVFTPANYTAVIQENKPVGTSILQLVVTDNDSFHNGPPFTFTILTGNEEEEFMLDPHGVLRSAVIFKHMVATEYMLCVQAKDSGKPQQVSHSYIQVRVIEESIHKPTAIPLEIFIVTMEDDFPGGVIGKIHATDQDMYDVLTYTLKSEQKSLFKVSSHDGKIIALGGLDNGKYTLNVSVSDGRFQVPIDVIVHMEQLIQEMLQNTVTIRFENVSPEDFVGLHMHGFRRTLRNAVLSQKQDSLHIISIQPVAGTNQLDMLFAVQMHNSGFYKPAYLIQKLTNARRHLENVIHISAILEKNCSGLDCQEQHCEQSLSIDSHSLMTYSTARISFVCPRFYRNVRCTCNGGLCPGSSDPCMEKPCPGDMQCVGYEASRRPFICQCPPGKLGECSGHTSLSFAGNSYIKYRVSENSKKEEFKLALRLRTLQSNGIIMYTRANPCIILKIMDGKLWFQLDCGSGPGILGISGRTVNDGNWHSVFLELNRNFTSLSLDDSYVERRKAPLYFQTLSTDSSVYFGAQVQVDNVRSLTDKRTTQVLSGFQGCLDSVILNNNELPLQNKRSSFAEVVGLTELKLGCVLYPDACERNPCQNGGSCTSLPSGGYQCSCLSQFTGRNCESEITVCFPNPCRNGGSCDPIGNAFICNCKNGLTGVTCEDDVNECEREECENGGSCINVFGSFLCNCTPGYVGQYCGLRPVVVPNIQAGHSYVGKEELIGIAVVLFVIFVLIILFIVFRKKVFRKNYSRNNITLVQDPATAALLNKSNGIQFKNLRNTGDSRNIYQEVGPPQVPVRPMAYTPCFQSDSRNNLDKIVDGLGVEHQEMTTFHPESPRILTARRGVVVCSVAPNLPAVSPCRSDCDSIRKSTWDGGTESKEVDDAEEVTCFAGSNKGSNSEVQSLSSFQSDSGDDNASIVTVIQLVNNVVDTIENEVSVMDQGQNYNRAYHWDTSDWMPSARLSDIEEVPNYETADGGSVHHGSNRELETDYYLGGYDIDSDYPPPHEEEFLSQDQLPPPLPEDYPDQYETLPPSQPVSMASTLSPDCRRRPQFHPSQYLPPHQFPNEIDAAGSQTVNEFSTFAVVPGQSVENVSAGKMPLSLHNSLDASSSDISASCGFDDSEVAMSDFESVEELILDNIHIPFVETQHQTQV